MNDFRRIAATVATVLLLGACSTAPREPTLRGIAYGQPAASADVGDEDEPGSGAASAPAAYAPTAPAVTPATYQSQTAPPLQLASLTTGDFPSSAQPAIGKAWTVQHANGYRGSLPEACSLLDLTAEQCNTLAARAVCTQKRFHNGIVLDREVFTNRLGQNVARSNVLVGLVAGPGPGRQPVWDAMDCDLGNGVHAGWFLGCGNFWRVDAPYAPAPAPQPPVAALAPPVAQYQPPPEPGMVQYYVQDQGWNWVPAALIGGGVGVLAAYVVSHPHPVTVNVTATATAQAVVVNQPSPPPMPNPCPTCITTVGSQPLQQPPGLPVANPGQTITVHPGGPTTVGAAQAPAPPAARPPVMAPRPVFVTRPPPVRFVPMPRGRF